MKRFPLKIKLLPLLLISTYSYAETVPEAQQSVELKQMTVTGQNRSTRTEHRDSYTTSAMRTTTGLALSPKETPQSVSVITKTQLNDRGITSMEDALKTTTGINVIPDSARWRYQSRGFYIDQIEEDGISSTVAGASGNPWNDSQSMTNLAFYDHIEVVRGATGLTQSNSEPGGTINAVRKRPTAQRQMSGDILIDRFGKAAITADVSGGLNADKSVRARVVGVLSSNESFKDKVDGNTKAVYGVMEADVGENSKITLGGLYQYHRETPDPSGLPMGNGYNLNLPYDTYLGADWNYTRFRKTNLFADFEHYFNDDWKLSSKLNYIRSHSKQEFAYITNSGGLFTGVGTDGTVGGATENIQKYQNDGKQFTFQNSLTGKFNAFNRKHNVFATYTYGKENNESFNVWKASIAHPYNIYLFDWGSIQRPDWSSNNANYTDTGRKIVNHAVSLGMRLNPWERWHILGAGRFTHWRYDYANHKTGVVNKYRRNVLVPYLGITFDVTPKHSLYTAYTTINKPQTVRDMDNKLLEPVKGTNIELGWKSDWFGNGKLNSSLALFEVVQKNRPYDLDVRNSAGNWAYAAIGKIRSRGLEAELSGNLTDDWKMFAGYTLNNSKYLVTESSRYTVGTNYSKHTPRHIFRLYSSYRLPFHQKRWTLGGGMTVQSKTNSLWDVKQGGYALWNANIQYEPTKNLKLSLIGNNLTDKRYYENHKVRTQGINNLYGEPRNIMFKLNWKL